LEAVSEPSRSLLEEAEEASSTDFLRYLEKILSASERGICPPSARLGLGMGLLGSCGLEGGGGGGWVGL